jgi:hypothetical protein
MIRFIADRVPEIHFLTPDSTTDDGIVASLNKNVVKCEVWGKSEKRGEQKKNQFKGEYRRDWNHRGYKLNHAQGPWLFYEVRQQGRERGRGKHDLVGDGNDGGGSSLLASSHLVGVLASSARSSEAEGRDQAVHAVLVLETILGSDTSTHDPVGVALDEAVADGALTSVDTSKVDSSQVARHKPAQKAGHEILEAVCR